LEQNINNGNVNQTFHPKNYILGLGLEFSFFVIFSDCWQKLAISEKMTRHENFQNRPNMTFYGLK